MKRVIRNFCLLAAALTTGLALGVSFFERTRGKALKALSEKYLEFYEILLQWLRLRQEGKGLESYFTKNGYRSIAIYGMKELGEALLEELENSPIEVKYAIDRNADALYVPIDVHTPEEELERVDAVVVTAIHYYDEIKVSLSEKMDCPILSLKDVVWGAS